MLKKFAVWFMCFGLSFLIEGIGWAEQGEAFLFAKLGVPAILIVLLIILCLISGRSLERDIGLSAIETVFYGIVIPVISLFATWIATKLFNVDYYVAFQIMAFGECLCYPNGKDN